MIGRPIAPTPPQPDTLYVTFADEITEQTASKFIHWMSVVTFDRNPPHESVHMLFNSSGGSIVDAINLYHYVKGYPPNMPITMYNTGAVQSAAVLIFLGAAHRIVTPYSKFLLHPAMWRQTAGANAEQHRIISRSLQKNDKDIDEILRTRIKMPESKWKQARRVQLEISGQEAVDFGFADDIGEWKVPEGSGIASLTAPPK